MYSIVDTTAPVINSPAALPRTRWWAPPQHLRLKRAPSGGIGKWAVAGSNRGPPAC